MDNENSKQPEQTGEVSRPSLIVCVFAIILAFSTIIAFSLHFANCHATSFDESMKEYEIKYEGLGKLTPDVQRATFSNALSSGVSPVEVRYLLNKIAPSVGSGEANIMLAQYINHLEYFSTTYVNIANAYASTLTLLSSKYDFTTRESAYDVSDRVLRALLLEIYDANMYLVVDNNKPYIFINYKALSEEFKDIAEASTIEYLDISDYTQQAKIATEDGQLDYSVLKSIMNKSSSFVRAYPYYPLVKSIAYKYSVALKMYLGVNSSGDVEYAEGDISRIKTLSEDTSDPVAASAAKFILQKISKDNILSAENVLSLKEEIDNLVVSSETVDDE